MDESLLTCLCLTLILKDLQSIENALNLFNSFSLCSGLKIDIEKKKKVNLL